MFVASYRNTMANAKPKFRAVIEEVPAAPVKRETAMERATRIWQERDAERMKNEAMKRAIERYRCISIIPVSSGCSAVERLELKARKIFQVSRADVRKHGRRNAKAVLARQFIMYWAARRTDFSLPNIGRLMGGFDHTSVLHGKNRYVEKRAWMGRFLPPARNTTQKD